MKTDKKKDKKHHLMCDRDRDVDGEKEIASKLFVNALADRVHSISQRVSWTAELGPMVFHNNKQNRTTIAILAGPESLQKQEE